MSKSRLHACTMALATLLLLGACRGGRGDATDLTPEPLAYARNICCERGEGFSVWTLRDPWDTAAVLHRYVLVSDTAIATERIASRLPRADAATSVVRVPLHRVGVATSVHCGLMDELGCSDAIAGVCESQYIDLPTVQSRLADGTITDFGNGMNPNIELIMDVAPDALLLTSFEHSGGYGRVERLGIPIIECAEYMEVSPLARAEWMRFYAELFGTGSRADSILDAVCADYESLRRLAADSTAAARRPRLFTEMLYGGQWFVPCAESTMGIMFADAGADYVFADRHGSGSTALAFETVFDAAADADLWLVKYNSATPLTYTQMEQDYKPYARFSAFSHRHVWGCDLARSHFYEQTPFHPERLLRDLIAIIHPELLPGTQPVYYQPLEP